MVYQRLALSIAIFIALCTFARIDTAVIPTEEFGDQIRQMLDENSEGSRAIRAVENGTVTNITRICTGEYMPCGWQVYERFTRRHLYYVRSTCVCDQGYVCLRERDELSTAAYAYFCRVDRQTNDDTPDYTL